MADCRFWIADWTVGDRYRPDDDLIGPATPAGKGAHRRLPLTRRGFRGGNDPPSSAWRVDDPRNVVSCFAGKP